MARIEWVERRLDNWALWKERQGSGGLGFATCSIFVNGPAARGQAEARIPVDEIDASITDDAVESLKLGHGHLHRTLHYFYVRGWGIKETASAMKRAESTIHAQLGQADALLATWFDERRRRGAAAASSMSVRAQLTAGPSMALHLAARADTKKAKQDAKGKRKPRKTESVRTSGAEPSPRDPPIKRSRPTLRLTKAGKPAA